MSEIKAVALENFEHCGGLLFTKGETYSVKKYCDRFFYPAKAKNKVLIPKGILSEIKE